MNTPRPTDLKDRKPRGPQPVCWRNPGKLICGIHDVMAHPPVIAFLRDVALHRTYARKKGYEDAATIIAWLTSTPVVAHLHAGGTIGISDAVQWSATGFTREWSAERAGNALAGCVKLGVLRVHNGAWGAHRPLKSVSAAKARAHEILRSCGFKDPERLDRAETTVALATILRSALPDPKPEMYVVIELLRTIAR